MTDRDPPRGMLVPVSVAARILFGSAKEGYQRRVRALIRDGLLAGKRRRYKSGSVRWLVFRPSIDRMLAELQRIDDEARKSEEPATE